MPVHVANTSESCQQKVWKRLESKKQHRGPPTMTLFDSVLRRLSPRTDRMGVENALALYRRGEARREGLTLTQVSHRLEVAWRARQIHPWARGCEPEEQGRRFAG